jgi:hypothetical protein
MRDIKHQKIILVIPLVHDAFQLVMGRNFPFCNSSSVSTIMPFKYSISSFVEPN